MEVSNFRCCMCPNLHKPMKKICPPGGPAQKPETSCRFVVMFLDNHKGKVFVTRGVGINKRKWVSIRQKGRKTCQLKKLSSSRSFDETQQALNVYAMNKGWSVCE